MTASDKKPSFHISHVIELVLASVLGAFAAKLLDITTPLYASVSTEVLVMLNAVIAAILLTFALVSAFIVYFIDYVQWKLRHRKRA